MRTKLRCVRTKLRCVRVHSAAVRLNKHPGQPVSQPPGSRHCAEWCRQPLLLLLLLRWRWRRPSPPCLHTGTAGHRRSRLVLQVL